jgi:gamma-glutamyltranspeptidase/glutathione hydrolase
MVACDNALATAAGIEMLADGGTAADAVVAADAVLGVVQPMSTGLGGDATCIVALDGSIEAYQGTGAAGAGLDHGPLVDAGVLDPRDPRLAVVPGVVDAWTHVLGRHGRLGMQRVLQPAIRLAGDGAPVMPVAAAAWARFGQELRHDGARATFLRDGRTPAPFGRFANPALRTSLERVAAGGPDAFYRGDIAESIARTIQAAGGVLSVDDLATHQGETGRPLSLELDEHVLAEVGPPNGGLIVLLAVALARHIGRGGDEVARVDDAVRAIESAFEDVFGRVGDPRVVAAVADELLAAKHLDELADRVRSRALAARQDRAGGTVVVTAADADGRVVSWASSLFQGFGCGVCPEDLGFCLNDRGFGFTAEAGHPNAPAAGKRPYHTVMPALLTDANGRAVAAFGFAGADMQPQAQVQLLEHVLAGADPQAALDAPRWHTAGGGRLELEDGWPEATFDALGDRGYSVERAAGAVFGRGQLLVVHDEGWYVGAADGRGDGLAAGW